MQDLLLLLRQLLRILGLSLRVGHHHGILAVLGLVHQQVGPAHDRLNNEKGISRIFVAVLVRFYCAIVTFLVFQLFHPLDERQRVPGQIVPGPPGCHRLQREGAVPERKRVERHRVVQVFQQLAAQEADAVPVGGQRRGRPDVAAFQNFGRMQAAAPQLL